MNEPPADQFGAGPSSLGYSYQSRLALLRLLQAPETDSVLLEKDDDVDFVTVDGRQTLASLKHKAVGDALTDLSVDFWKSVRIWLVRYDENGRIASRLRFLLLTTSKVSATSFVAFLLEGSTVPASTVRAAAEAALAKTKADDLKKVRDQFNLLTPVEKEDFLRRILVYDSSPRITDVPRLVIDQHMRTIRREFRIAVYERLEGWWDNIVIELLSHKRESAVSGQEVSDKLATLADEYKTDNLPIHFSGHDPADPINTSGDPRVFVTQLREIGISAARIRTAIIDYYRAFSQRAAWAREQVLLAGEIEKYEERLIEEWERYRDVVVDELDPKAGEEALREAGNRIYKWAQFETEHIRIRERVSEPYVVRGGFQILANFAPVPLVHWHPKFLERIATALGEPDAEVESKTI